MSKATALLTGRRIVLTRPTEQSGDWRRRLERLGVVVLELPLIRVTKDVDLHLLAEIFPELGRYEWLVFTSANGVKYFFEEFHRVFDDIRSLGFVRIAAVGTATAAALRAQHLRIDLLSDKATGEALARALLARESMDSAKVLVVTGSRNRETLVQLLHDNGAIVDTLPVYRTEETDLTADPAAADFRALGADAILFASPSAVQSYADQATALKLAPNAQIPLNGSIGPTTTEALKEFGLTAGFEAGAPDLDSLLTALVARLK